MSQEDVVALLDRVANDQGLRAQLATLDSADDLIEVVASLGFDLGPGSSPDVLTDGDLDGVASEATDRTCYGTTDCCHTKHTCFGTTACCH